MSEPLTNERWLLPEGIEELLPAQAEHVERLRRELLDLFHAWGYELVIPPLIEYIESLLIGTGTDLDLQTFKLIDQLSGRLMGVRADMTPQVARIESHRLQRDAPARLCYIGEVLRTTPQGFLRTRSPLQMGAEIYGHAGLGSDVEVIHLMVEALHLAGVEKIHVGLGHVGIFRGLANAAGLDAAHETALFNALQRKARSEIAELLAGVADSTAASDGLLGLINLNGGVEVLQEARTLLQGAAPSVLQALEYLEKVARALGRRLPEVPLHFDLAELRGYHYQTGIVYAAYVPGHGQEVARGGRYDEIGRAFGRARPATGFSTDLHTLVALSENQPQPVRAILAPHGIFETDAKGTELHALVRSLRAAGQRVIYTLPGAQGDPAEQGCDRILQWQEGRWIVVPWPNT